MAEFPEIRPQDATPEIAALYADIRAVSGVPVVNLIWRHIAAFPGALDWAWSAVRPLVGSRQMAAARRQVADAVVLPALAPVEDAAWRQAGADERGLTAIAAILDAYIQGNLTNLVALSALRLRLDTPDGVSAQFTPAPLAPPAVPLPAFPRIDALEPGLAAQVRALAAQHDGAGDGVIPSLYLALAPWPGVIARLPAWLGPLYQPATLHAARNSAIRAAGKAAAVLLPAAPPPPPGIEAVRPGLERFTRVVIPDLSAICLALHRLLPEH